MRDGYIGFTDAHLAELAEIARDVDAAQADLSAARARLTRALARGEDLARTVAASSPVRVRANDMALRSIAAELGAAQRVSDRTMQRRMDAAAELARDYPRTLDALEAGRIHEGHVRLITEAGTHLPSDARPGFEADALPRCETDTPGRVRAGIEILAERAHPRTLTDRHVDARETRTLTLFALPDGMSELSVRIPTILGEGIHDRATRMARALLDLRVQAKTRVRDAQAAGVPADPADDALAADTRTMDQLRADIVTDLLLTAQPGADPTRTDDGPGTLGAIRAHVQVTVPALTLLGVDEHPADLAGRSPIDADTARRLAGGSCTGWDRILTHPATGQMLATDRRDIPPGLRRRIRARDQHCRFPGCRAPAIRCDIDHTHDHALGGTTCDHNLECLCRRHHSMKHCTAWKVRQLIDGTLEWTSPLGAIYIDDPPIPAVHFAPTGHVTPDALGDDDPPPW